MRLRFAGHGTPEAVINVCGDGTVVGASRADFGMTPSRHSSDRRSPQQWPRNRPGSLQP